VSAGAIRSFINEIENGCQNNVFWRHQSYFRRIMMMIFGLVLLTIISLSNAFVFRSKKVAILLLLITLVIWVLSMLLFMGYFSHVE
jgi:predicted membrane protein